MSTETYHMKRQLSLFDFSQNWKRMANFNEFFAIKYHGSRDSFMGTDRRSDFNTRSWGLRRHLKEQ
jgi:hypothetical protein